MYTEFNIVCAICQHKHRINLCNGKIRCSMRFTNKAGVKFEDAITWFCDVTCNTSVHYVGELYALLRYSLIHGPSASGDDGSFPKYQIKRYDFEPLAASDHVIIFQFGSFGAV